MKITPETTVRELQLFGTPSTLLSPFNQILIFDGTVQHLVHLVCKKGFVTTTAAVKLGDYVSREDVSDLPLGTGLVADSQVFIVSKNCLTTVSKEGVSHTITLSKAPFSQAEVVSLP